MYWAVRKNVTSCLLCENHQYCDMVEASASGEKKVILFYKKKCVYANDKENSIKRTH